MLLIDKVEMDWGLFLLSEHVRSFNLHPKREEKRKKKKREREREEEGAQDDGRDRIIGWAHSEAGELWWDK